MEFQTYKGTFTCNFAGTTYYPFGSENCTLVIFIAGPENTLTSLNLTKLIYNNTSVNQYDVIEWNNVSLADTAVESGKNL